MCPIRKRRRKWVGPPPTQFFFNHLGLAARQDSEAIADSSPRGLGTRPPDSKSDGKANKDQDVATAQENEEDQTVKEEDDEEILFDASAPEDQVKPEGEGLPDNSSDFET